MQVSIARRVLAKCQGLRRGISTTSANFANPKLPTYDPAVGIGAKDTLPIAGLLLVFSAAALYVNPVTNGQSERFNKHNDNHHRL